ncbi:MAG: TRAP transporter large permease subunit [Candidatus Poseidoniia archaeon]|jgi:tripartite ATP-independent transporter DctM subunit|nr:TRAP transporter large permease subunit [Candidatus Poseidoniia archaeon]MDP7452838.1 TRAP transporter large permease subunit [Arenicellales bacterium]|tara:strand:- start:969 stop:2240 length:1272 start_codon:yes stop_codon:yes gene_type:complete
MEAVLILGGLLTLFIFRVPVAFALGGLGVFLLWWMGFNLNGVPQRLYGTMDSFELLAVPLFLLMSNVLLKGGVGKDLFAAVQSWVGHWPGGLGVATILSCGIFSAISGSSVATAATIGTVAMPEMEKRGYERSFIFGLLAAGGTLGIMIPPSIPLIIYGVVTESSIPTLFLAGIGPGLSLIAVFIAFSIYSAKRSGFQPAAKANLRERVQATIMAFPTIGLAIAIIGSIYMGLATPSESAGVGFILSLMITFAMGRMNWKRMVEAVDDSMKTTIMVFLIVAGAKVFSYAITLYRIPQDISQLITEYISNPSIFILTVGIVLLFMGFFLESLSMLLIMVPVLFPSLVTMMVDPIWFGIFFVLLIETALITPPVGMNLFVIQAVGKTSLQEVVKGAWPFSIIMLSMAVILWFLPQIALYIPYNFY